MKFLFSALIFTIGLFLLSSCNRPDVKLPSKEGKWNYSWVTSFPASDTSISMFGTMTFSKDGSGTYTIEPSAQNSPFTWSYDKSGKKLNWVVGASEFEFDIKEAKAKTEKWHMTGYDGNSGNEINTDITLTR